MEHPTTASAVSLSVGADGVAVLRMDVPGRPMNVVGDTLMRALAECVEAGLADPAVKGLVLASGKADFCAGGDIDALYAIATAEEAFRATESMKAVLRRMETGGKPVAAAITGHALGGGLEIALACHARFVLDDPKLKLGQPEVKIGLLPGGGGTVRLPRLVGIQAALQIMGEGEDIAPQKALAMGLITGLAPTKEGVLDAARAWVLANPKTQAPWDAPKFRFPGGDSRSPAVVQMFSIGPAIAAGKTWNNYPAVQHIMSSVFEGGLLGFEAASTVESRYFAACATSPVAKNLIGTLWFGLNGIPKGASRPAGHAPSTVKKLGVLGAGMMGAGIAWAAAKVGIEVVLIDTTQEAAERGKAYSAGLLDKALKRGRITPQQREAHLARITPTTDFARLEGCDLVIEAVFEDRAVKAEVTRRAERVIGEGAVFASNTSTLPITGLAEASVRAANFIGLHFFSPVDKMPLVEIIIGRGTSEATLARAFDFVLQIGKTPIVVNDSRGFYTSRVFGTYVMEGAAMLVEGIHPRHIEVAGQQAGMPMPPLALQDEVSLSLSVHVADQTAKDLAAEGRSLPEHPGLAVVRRLAAEGRIGRKAGRGFYDWPAADAPKGTEKRLWPGLAAMFPVRADQPPQADLIHRLMFAQANEAARCFEEGVVRSVADANIGSIFGWGFAPFQGGALQYINAMGPAAFVQRARQLAAAHGPRFEPAAIVVKMAAEGGRFA
jgi:3-hydroxyacyl-CoA dehydrogenase/enoyl-CoA hydratase/3-hydroxybutyryl-CoA epimerase